MKNDFCDLTSLRNEADVEQSFVRRFLESLGYADDEIRPKSSLKELSIGGMRGHPRGNYRPDFGLQIGRKISWIVEVKAPGEDLDRHEWQPRAYCVLLNGTGRGKVVRYHLLTNGARTRLYDPDRNDPLLELRFSDFAATNAKFKKLTKLLRREALAKSQAQEPVDLVRIEKKPLAEVNAAFAWCHQHIYKKDNVSQSDAFTEFVKLIALKLMSDRNIRDRHPEILADNAIDLPASEVPFSIHWIEQHEKTSANPVSDVQFRQFMNDMEVAIATGRRKRIFDENDVIRLRPETIRGVVKRLEGIFLFGIDADLNGRLFETFLNATMRGKDLGQFFTPRSLVKLGVGLARIQVGVPNEGGRHTDTIVDACCGSGGFLIDALANMWAKAGRMNLSEDEISALKLQIANNHIVGIDIANAPKLARIARLNMYLHGDGGTRIYHLNALDKEQPDERTDTPESAREKAELRELLSNPKFDVALTNPPFAKAVDRTTEGETRLLDQYEIGRENGAPRASVRSALLFLERYADILKPGGRLVTVIDDGILSGDDHKWFRDQLRTWFLIRAVISLPGDAFQRANARVKTSYVVAERREAGKTQAQPPVFMYPCRYVGLDDPKRQRPRAGDAELRKMAEQEIAEVMREYDAFLKGDASKYAVSADRVADRLDVKNCLVSPGRRVADWQAKGFEVVPLSDLVRPRLYSEDDVITKDHPEPVKVMVVRYEGIAEAGEEIFPADGSYAKLYPVKEDDVVISNIAASHGSIAVVPKELDGSVVSNEYTVLEPLEGRDAVAIQLVLRSPEVRSDILLSASGANRTRTRWQLIKDLMIPYPGEALLRAVRQHTDAAEEAKRKAREEKESARATLERSLLLRSEEADTVLAAFKPPK